jgi:YHS domain-containing protein
VTTGKIGRDPVCGMNIDEDRARAEGNVREYRGKTYFFCTPVCRDDFGKQPERYLKLASAQGSMPMPGSPDAAMEHASHGPATVPKPRGAKTAHEAHEGMTMPAAQPSTAAPGTGPQLPVFPGQGSMSMPQGAAPMMPGTQAGAAIPGPKTGEMFPSATGAPEMNRQPRPFPGPGPGDKPLPGSPGPAPMPGSMSGPMISPPTVAPGMNQGPPAFPGPGGAPMSGPQPGGMAPPVPGMGPGTPEFPGQRGVPGPMPQEAAPMSGVQTEEVAPQAPVIRTPRINPRLQRFRPPGTMPQAGPQGAAPMPGSNTGETLPPATGAPEAKP